MKRRYAEVTVKPVESGYGVWLDAIPLRTPAGNAVIVPNEALADALADEWRRQPETIAKDRMMLTQLASIAIDLAGVAQHEKRGRVIGEILDYAATDLVCYRAGHAPDLAKRQQTLLAPVIAWAEGRFALALTVTEGLIPVAQPVANDAGLQAELNALDGWRLALLAFIIKPLGSAILGLSFLHRRIDAADAFTLSHLEETYETEKWGEDSEKEIKLNAARSDIAAAAQFLALLGPA